MKRIKYLVNHSYSKSVFFVTAGAMVGNVSNYLFHVIGGRYLGPSLYGSLASLISLLYIVSILTGVFTTVTLRELTKLWTRGEKSKFYLLLKSSFSFFILCGILLFLIFFFASPFIADYLNLQNNSFVFLIGVIGFLSAVSCVFGAFQQATLRFKQFSFFTSIASFAKIVFVLLNWYFNFLIFGMLWAIILSSLAYFFLNVFDLYIFFKKKPVDFKKPTGFKFSPKSFFKKSSFVLMSNLGMTGFLTSDTILVKHFFSPSESGLYAGTAVMGRVILFITGPLLVVMMPLIIKRREKQEDFKKIFFLTLFLVFFVSSVLLLFYTFFPKIIISLFYGNKYLEAQFFLPLFGIYILFYTLSNVFVVYYIAMEKRKTLFLPLIIAALQIILINLFHKTLFQVIKASIFCPALLLAVFLIKFIRDERKNEKI